MVENVLVSRFRVLMGTMERRTKVVRDIVLTCVAHQGRADRAPIPGNDTAAMQNEQMVHVPDENNKNPLGEDKHLRKLLKV